jgi:16S rRNA (guanine527-N7)-methyltransferase
VPSQESDRLFRLYNVSRESQERLRLYVDLLLTWQNRINLIGPSTVAHVWDRHICDALQLAPLIPKGCQSIADLGTGPGIPGIVLGIASGTKIHLYESSSKKCAFLHEAIRRTGVDAEVHCGRLERIPHSEVPVPIGCIVSRALAPLTLLLEYAAPFFGESTVGLFHKGRDVGLELTQATKYWRFQSTKHQSACDSQGVILEVREVCRV